MGNYKLNETIYFKTFPEMLTGFKERYRDQPAVSQYSRAGEESIKSYRQQTEDVFALAEEFCSRGFAGKHIAIVGENSYEWLVSFLAITCCGGVAVCIDTEQAEDSICRRIRYADANAVIASSTYAPICEPLIQDHSVENIFVIDGAAGDQQETVAEMIEKGREKLNSGSSLREKIIIDPQQTAMIVFTSGTTDEAKPVMLSHIGVMTNIGDSLSHVTAGRSVFTALPFYHSYGLVTCVLVNMLHGAHMYINGNMKTMMRDLYTSKAEAVGAVPLMLEALYQHLWNCAEKVGKKEQVKKLVDINLFLSRFGLSFRRDLLVQLKEKAIGPLCLSSCGGAHLGKKISDELKLFGITVMQGYGITECSPVIAINCDRSNRMGTVGHVLPNFDIRFVDDEIWVKGISVMKGYYKNEELTKDAIEDGWFKTGDLGSMDKQKFLHITGRKKNLIVFKNGKKVMPEIVEEKILKIPLVKDAVVYGAANSEKADDVKLAVSIYPNEVHSKGMESFEILDHLQKEIEKINAELPFYQKIQLINIRDNEFERTSSHKIKRELV